MLRLQDYFRRLSIASLTSNFLRKREYTRRMTYRIVLRNQCLSERSLIMNERSLFFKLWFKSFINKSICWFLDVATWSLGNDKARFLRTLSPHLGWSSGTDSDKHVAACLCESNARIFRTALNFKFVCYMRNRLCLRPFEVYWRSETEVNYFVKIPKLNLRLAALPLVPVLWIHSFQGPSIWPQLFFF